MLMLKLISMTASLHTSRGCRFIQFASAQAAAVEGCLVRGLKVICVVTVAVAAVAVAAVAVDGAFLAVAVVIELTARAWKTSYSHIRVLLN